MAGADITVAVDMVVAVAVDTPVAAAVEATPVVAVEAMHAAAAVQPVAVVGTAAVAGSPLFSCPFILTGLEGRGILSPPL
jgi:hypothetical protein